MPNPRWSFPTDRSLHARRWSRGRRPRRITALRLEPIDAWRACKRVCRNRSAQKGTRAQCAEPGTGSSGMPGWGAKKHEMKSHPSSPRAVTITQQLRIAASRPKSGRRARTMARSASSTSLLKRFRPIHAGLTPRAASSSCASCGSASASGGVAGGVEFQPLFLRGASGRGEGPLSGRWSGDSRWPSCPGDKPCR